MKIITFAVPCRNSAAHMEKCVNSLLEAGCADIEIVIIDDGSTDQTAEIAGNYARNFAGVVKVIRQANAGHGGAINTGLAAATGKYFKVIDSDDYVDKAACAQIVAALRGFADTVVDLVISNYVYENIGKRNHKVINYAAALPEKRVISWTETRRFPAGKYLLMHALIYRTEVLRECGLILPLHTFYVDNLFAYIPLPSVKTLYYINVDFYRYTTGSAMQSVNESTMIKRIDQQIMVNKLMFAGVDLNKIQDTCHLAYMLHYLEIVSCVTMILLIRAKTKEALAKQNALWTYIQDIPIARDFLRRSLPLLGLCRTGKIGRLLSVVIYRWVRRIYSFN